jgi:8-oxo-dGTP pyrophosphatase MutT (NUDIX family)
MTTRTTNILFRTPRFEVAETLIEDSRHGRATFFHIQKPDGVSIIATQDRKILLLKVNRLLTDTFGYELPGGRIDDGEIPLDAAQREFLEETNLPANSLTHLDTIYAFPTLCSERIYIYTTILPEKETLTNPLQPHEGIQSLELFTPAEIIELIDSSQLAMPADVHALFLFLFRSNALSCR